MCRPPGRDSLTNPRSGFYDPACPRTGGAVIPLIAEGRNDLLTNGLTSFTHVGALTALTGTEVAGGSYARQAVTWTAAAAGIRDNNAQFTIPIPASTTVVAGAIYDAATTGNQEGYFQIGSTLWGVASVDTTSTDIFQSDGHGLVITDRVFVSVAGGEAPPAGLDATSLYYVINSTTDTFQLSATSGGTSVAITGLNEFTWHKTVPETFGSAGNLVITANALDVIVY